MLHIPLEQLEEGHLRALEEDGIAEGLRLEFKQTLDLADRRSAREVAKDISALANTVGGRILYGVSERSVEGEPVAGPLTPLVDAGLRERLENVLADSVEPRPQFQSRNVPVKGGWVLVVEVFPSFGADLHMVSSFKEGRFYRRLGSRTVPMSEPEIREAYARITSDRDRRDEKLAKLLEREIETRPTAEQSILVFPLFPHSNMADPRVTIGLAAELADGPLKAQDKESMIRNIRTYSDGLRAVSPMRADPASAELYFTVGREGGLHLSRQQAFWDDHGHQALDLRQLHSDLLALMEAADLLLDHVSYWGAVRIVLRVRAPQESSFYPPRRSMGSIGGGAHQVMLEPGSLRAAGSDFRLLAKELFDLLFQRAGRPHCPYIDDEGAPSF